VDRMGITEGDLLKGLMVVLSTRTPRAPVILMAVKRSNKVTMLRKKGELENRKAVIRAVAAKAAKI